MKDRHIEHSEFVAAADGELPENRAAAVREHLEACWACRARMKEIEDTVADFVRAHRSSNPTGPADAARAMLRVRLAQAAALPAPSWRDRLGDYFLEGNRLAYLGGSMAAVVAILFVVGVVQVSRQQFRPRPDPELTPGRVVAEELSSVCQGPAPSYEIPRDVGRLVFDRYGIDRPGNRGYELDYLIPPELGGAADPRNLWPQPYLSEWNAHLKDALEDRLHKLVCEDELSLAVAQNELATDWIAAYKKYFGTDHPILGHREFTKDSPWEP